MFENIVNILFSIIKGIFNLPGGWQLSACCHVSQTKKAWHQAGLHVSGNGRCKSCRLKAVLALHEISEHLMVALKLIYFLIMY